MATNKSIYEYFKMSSKTGRVLHLPIKLLPRNHPLPVLSGPLKGMQWFVRAGMATQWLGIYEKKKIALLSKFIKEGMTVFDVGAHVGFYTLVFSKYVGSKGKIIAFEPLPENAAYLIKNIKANHIEGNVAVYPCAISSSVRFERFEIREHNAIGGLSAKQSGSVLMVPVFNLDNICRIGIDNGNQLIPDIVKMDIEGEEARALEGSSGILSKGKTIWFVAIHTSKAFNECLGIFDRYDYDVFSLDGIRLTGPADEIDEIYALPRKL